MAAGFGAVGMFAALAIAALPIPADGSGHVQPAGTAGQDQDIGHPGEDQQPGAPRAVAILAAAAGRAALAVAAPPFAAQAQTTASAACLILRGAGLGFVLLE